MDFIIMIQDEFDNTLATDLFFANKRSNTLTAEIYQHLQCKRQELCESINKELCAFLKEILPYPDEPLTPEVQPDTIAEIRKLIRLRTNLDELVFRMGDMAGKRMLNRMEQGVNNGQ